MGVAKTLLEVGDPGVVGEEVEAPEGLERRRDRALGRVGLSDVGGDSGRPATLRPELSQNRLERPLVLRCGNEAEVRALVRQAVGDRPSDAARSARNDSRSTLEPALPGL